VLPNPDNSCAYDIAKAGPCRMHRNSLYIVRPYMDVS
jgi:hypothetical protein